MIKNRLNILNWTFTSVYRPIDNNLKVQFWEELRHIRPFNYIAWLYLEILMHSDLYMKSLELALLRGLITGLIHFWMILI
jgi:hypothetical protein